MSLTYLGLPVLDIIPHVPDTPSVAFSHLKARFDSGTGKLFERALETAPRTDAPTSWYLRTLADIQAFRAFTRALQGRLNPFWLPTYRPDLLLTADVPAASSTLTITECGYAATVFGATFARRHLCLSGGNGAILACRQVLTAVNNFDGTETLELDGTVDTDLTSAHTLVSYLLYVRLAEDAISRLSYRPDLAIGTLPTTEIPLEAPGAG